MPVSKRWLQAYQPYITLLNDEQLGQQAQALRNYIYRRWQRTIPEDQLASSPAVVRLGIAQMARMEGQRLAQQAQQAKQDIPQEAIKKLKRAAQLCQSLQQSEDLPQSVRAEAMFNQAVAQYWMNPNQMGNRLAAAELFTNLASQMETYSRADEAMANAISLLHGMYQIPNHPPQVDKAYRHAAEVLFQKYPQSKTADNERLYYAFHVLEQDGQYAEAAKMLAAIPDYHPDYFEAQRERLHAMYQVYLKAEAEEKQPQAQRVTTAAKQLQTETADALAKGDRIDTARRARGGARLVLAKMAAADGNVDQSLSLLEDFEQTFSGETDLIRDAQTQRILALIDVAQQKQAEAMAAAQDAQRSALSKDAEQIMQRAVAQAKQMMEQYPADAAGVIDQVLTQLEQQIDAKRTQAAEAAQRQRAALLESADQMANVAAELANTLVKWAQQQNYDDKQMLPYRLIQAQSLRLAAKPGEAAQVLEPFMKQFGQDATLITEYANALFAQGDKDNLIKAAHLYDKLITGLQPPYPDIWWNAWMHRLQINDRLGQATGDIALRIRQLKRTDPNLGGPPYKQELQRLQDKYSQ